MDNSTFKINIDKVLREAFRLWSSVLRYNVVFTFLYFGLMLIFARFLLNYYGLSSEITELTQIFSSDPELFSQKAQELSLTENYRFFTLMTVVATAFIYPLHIGMFTILRKTDLAEEVSLNDLFAGFKGSSFFRYAGFYLFWGMIFYYAKLMVFPAILWLMITIVAVPFMLFDKDFLGAAIGKSSKAAFSNFFKIFIVVLIGVLFSYFGVMLFFIGLLFTYPFFNALAYSVYKAVRQ